MRRTGPTFALKIECDGALICGGRFPGLDQGGALSLSTELFDQRIPGGRGRVELSYTTRGTLGLMARLVKDAVPGEKGAAPSPRSASGEWKFFREDESFSMDLGVDEWLPLVGNARERIAALELKLSCSKRP